MRVSSKQLKAALTEWDRRYRESPEEFENEAERLINGTPETYGDEAGPYLESIIKELCRKK